MAQRLGIERRYPPATPGTRASPEREMMAKVGWSLLTTEGAPCHGRFSSGELLCELAAALDYATSGASLYPLFTFCCKQDYFLA